MWLSPEFRRNLWLSMRPHNMLIMPVLMGLVLYIAFSAGDWPTLHYTTLTLYVVVTMLWGVRLAGEALIEEIDNRTWDQQRMSAITPWQMSWGKLFGSTVFVWYGALLLLPLFIISGVIIDEPMLLTKLLLLLSGAVLLQGLALLISLLMVRRNGSHRRVLSNLALVVALLVISVGAAFYDERPLQQLGWYGWAIGELLFVSGSTLLFCGWVLLALQRSMAEELQYKNRPTAWLAFTLFLIFYVMGFSPLEFGEGEGLNLAGAYVVALLLCYAMIFVERKEPLDLRRFRLVRQQQGFAAALVYTPCWLVSLIVVIILGLALLAVASVPLGFIESLLAFDQVILLSLLFLLRDLGIVIYFNLLPNNQRSDATALVYLALLYLLLPTLFSIVGALSLYNLLMPIATTNPLLTGISGLAQCALLGWLIYQRWSKYYKT